MATAVLSSSAGTASDAQSAPTTPVVRTEGARSVVVLSGEWDLSRRPVLAEVLARVIASGTGDVVVDLAGAQFIDTAIGRALTVGCRWLARGGRRLTVRSPSPLAARILGAFGLTDLIEAPEGAAPAPGGPKMRLGDEGSCVYPRQNNFVSTRDQQNLVVSDPGLPNRETTVDQTSNTRRTQNGR